LNAPGYDPRPQFRLDGPFLTEGQLRELREAVGDTVPHALVLDATFTETAARDGKAISRRIADLTREVMRAALVGETSIVLLSDRAALASAPRRLPLPMLLITASIHNALTEGGRRRQMSIGSIPAKCKKGTDAALLIANGADAICPHTFLGFADADKEANLIAALDGTLRRVMSKMGITTLDGYRGSRLFESVGVAAAVTDYYLPGIQSHIGGIDLDDIYEDIVARANAGSAPHYESESHGVSQGCLAATTRNRAWQRGRLRALLALVRETPPVYLRDLLRWKPPAEGGEVAVANAEEIIRACFRGAAMSHGALHRTAHRAIRARVQRVRCRSPIAARVRRFATRSWRRMGNRSPVASGRSARGASASRRATWCTPTKFKSRSVRARSPARAACCPPRK